MITARRAERDDVTGVEALVGRGVAAFVKKFGQFSIPHLIETSMLAVSVVDDSDNIVGFASFQDSPPARLGTSELQQDCYEWFAATFRSEDFGLENTVWLTFFVANEGVQGDAADRLLQTVFSTLPSVEGVLAVLPQEVPNFTPLTEMFEQLSLIDETYYGPQVFACPRSLFIPTLHIRKAVIEDHDDLVPVFNEQSEVLTDIYGEFFLADLIENKDANAKSLVAEINERAVGLMSITDKIDVDLLRHTFDLSPYDDLYVVEQEEEAAVEEKAEEHADEEESTPQERLANMFSVLAQGAQTLPEKAIETLLRAYVNSLDVDDENPDQGLVKTANDLLDKFMSTSTAKPAPAAKAPAAKAPAAKAPAPDKEFTKAAFVTGIVAFSEGTKSAMLGVLDFLETKMGIEHANKVEVTQEKAKVEEVPAKKEPVITEINNCFAITLFCLDEGFEARSMAFLGPAFALFPDKEYCIATLPHTAQEPTIMAHFTRVPSKPNSTLGHVLYLLHRDSVMINSVALRWLAPGDMNAVQDLVATASNKGDIINEVNAALASRKQAVESADGKQSSQVAAFQTKKATFAVECLGQVVGLVCLDERQDVEMLRSDFALEDYVELKDLYPDNEYDDIPLKEKRKSKCLQATLKYFIVNPLFQNKAPLIFREVMRKYHKAIIYYEVRPGEPLQDVIETFIQVRPRTKPEQSPDLVTLEEGSNGADPKPYLPYEPLRGHFALHMLTRRLLFQPKARLNARLVIVGASDTALALLENLLLQSDLNYSSITLLSRAGLPRGRDVSAETPNFNPWSLTWDAAMMRKLSFESRIRVIANELVDLDCDKQHVVLSDGAILPYDYLVLTPGLQDQTAGVLGVDLSQCSGLFSVSTPEEVEDLLGFLQEGKPDQVVVYGNSHAAVCTIRGLIDAGIAATSITWAYPYAEEKPRWCSNDLEIDKRLKKVIHKLGISVLPSAQLVDVKHNAVGMLEEVNLMIGSAKPGEEKNKGKKTTMPCQVLVCCQSTDVDAAIFTASTENSLVYDGRMVVDAQFATSDRRVFAAGTVAKFSRQYGRTLNQERYSAEEIGRAVAECALRVMDPLTVNKNIEATAHTMPPELGKLPKVYQGELPGGLTYFEAVKPVLQKPKQPKIIMTKAQDNICRLMFDEWDVLISIMYIGTGQIQGRNLAKLVGLPSSYLNRILWRYESGMISDLISFLQAPWATALAHESFRDLSEQINESFVEKEMEIDALIKKYIEHLTAQQEGKKPPVGEVSRMIETMFQREIKEELQIKVLKFLNIHANHLPGYQVKAEKNADAKLSVSSVIS